MPPRLPPHNSAGSPAENAGQAHQRPEPGASTGFGRPGNAVCRARSGRLGRRQTPVSPAHLVCLICVFGDGYGTPSPQPASAREERTVPQVTYPEFKKVEMVVGLIQSVEPHPNADKLFIMKVDIGEAEPRQLVAGLKPYYEADALVGKRIVVVANLAPANLRGVDSNGMLLAAQSGDRVIVLTTDEEMPPGSKVL
ncbi:methionine--tRNA ligase subunit beta [Planctomycetota bacterium]